MKITGAMVTPFSIPYRVVTASGAARSEGTNRVLVRVETDAGLEGAGEVPLFQAALPQIIEELVFPALLGQDPYDIEPILKQIECQMHARLYPRAAMLAFAPVEVALWDIVGKDLGKPVFKLLGGQIRDEIEMAGIVFGGSAQERAHQAKQLVDEGYRTVKMKVGTDVIEDIRSIQAVRQAVSPQVALRVDPNQSWSLATAKRVLKQIEDCDLQYLEQPLRLDDLQGLAELRVNSRTPIAVNESAYTLDEVLKIIVQRAADVIMVDPFQAGGLWQAKKICALAEAAGLPVSLHTSADTSLGLAAHLQLAASTPNLIYATDTLFPINADDLARQPLVVSSGRCAVPDGPGLGVELDAEALQRAVSRPPIRREWVRMWL